MAQKTPPQAVSDNEFSVFNAYQHFLYNINIDHLKKNTPWDEHLTDHFMSKIRGIQAIEKAEFLTVSVIYHWIQEMTLHYQRMLLGYIIKYHSNKG